MPAVEELGLAPEILRAIEEVGWNLPSDIQDEAIPLILGGGDAMAAAQTGSGKTGGRGRGRGRSRGRSRSRSQR